MVVISKSGIETAALSSVRAVERFIQLCSGALFFIEQDAVASDKDGFSAALCLSHSSMHISHTSDRHQRD
jgi:hypothetical protein